jgi:hypothetical protein
MAGFQPLSRRRPGSAGEGTTTMLISKRTPKLIWRITGRTPTPIPFIVGAPRSGTTLLRVMLDAHPDLTIPPETYFFPRILRTCGTGSDSAGCFLERLLSHRRWTEFQVDAELLKERVSRLRPFQFGDALRVFYGLYAAKFSKPRWGDKTPGYSSWMNLIQTHIPEARFVHLIRDGRDVALSIKGLSFGPNSIEEAAGWWVARVAKARDQVMDIRYYLEIRYEDLILDTEPTLRKICEFIDLPWDPVLLEYREGAEQRLADLRDIALKIRPPDASRVGRWRTAMTRAQREQFETVAGKMLAGLGYDLG